MHAKRRKWWPWFKAGAAAVILFFIARRFAQDLAQPELYREPIRVGWLVGSGLLYLAGIGFSGLYWCRLLACLGHPVSLGMGLRAYYVSQVAKYLPGKAGALILRVGMVRGEDVPAGVGGLATFYEVLVTMAAGSLLAVVLGALVPGHVALSTVCVPGSFGDLLEVFRWEMLEEDVIDTRLLPLLALALTAVTLGAVLPPIFNWLVRTVSLPFRRLSPGPMPPVGWRNLLEGLSMTVIAWLLMGSSLALALLAVPGIRADWGPMLFGYLTAALAVAYVAGFVVVIAPGGLGVREFLLTGCLGAVVWVYHDSPGEELARGKVVLAVLLLRLAWTVAEVVLAAILYPLPWRASQPPLPVRT
jgi:uncharacterized membrane protein YbhN (UPF0104 family)